MRPCQTRLAGQGEHFAIRCFSTAHHHTPNHPTSEANSLEETTRFTCSVDSSYGVCLLKGTCGTMSFILLSMVAQTGSCDATYFRDPKCTWSDYTGY
mmetsp:Transcript_6374/g.9328  ORF Transcript_6374/g.9328 Transcript_6374/m.9328 type:complete len:97 (-) Transcript_6374:218-508(-)